MTRAAQKAEERSYLERFLKDLVTYTDLECEGQESPDCWVTREGQPRLGIEVVTYHPKQQGAVEGMPRVQIEARWWRGILPILERERQSRPTLAKLRVWIHFNDRRLAVRSEHQRLALEIIGIMEALAALPDITSEEFTVVFVSREDATRVGGRFHDCLFLVDEDWPLAKKNLNCIKASHFPLVDWPPITCPDIQGAWVGTDVDDARGTLEDKIERAWDYDIDGCPLWLLVVFETPGDLQSHAFPRTDEVFAKLVDGLRAAGVDLANSPFAEVWLFSDFTGQRLRLHPRQAG